MPVEEREREELLDGAAVELGLEGPVESGEGLSDLEAAALDAPLDAALALDGDGLGEQALDDLDVAGMVLLGPGQVGVDIQPDEAQSAQVLLDPFPSLVGGSCPP